MKCIVSSVPDKTGGEALSLYLQAHHERQILLLVSGGSAMSLLSYVDQNVLGPHITLGVLDERYSFDPQVQNFSQLSALSFFELARSCGVATLGGVPEENETAHNFCMRFEKALHDWRKGNQDGVVVVTMGIGEDGHTAGIFPHSEGLTFDGENWVVSYRVPEEVNQYRDRITVTNTFLRTEVEQAFVFIQGQNKQNALHSLLATDGSLLVTPARIFHEMKNVEIHTDIE